MLVFTLSELYQGSKCQFLLPHTHTHTHTCAKAYTVELEQMENPTSIQPLIAEKNSQIRAVSEKVTQLTQEMQEISSQRDEHIQHMRRESLSHSTAEAIEML